MSSTAHTVNIFGFPILIPNEVSRSEEEYYVSYNNYDTHIYESDTTALVLIVNGHTSFHILNGDHRKAYEACSSLEECIEYFKSNSDLINKYSEDLKW